MKNTRKNKRRYKTNLIKKTVPYSTNEIADLIQVHPRTVQQWYKAGLRRIDDKRPYLVMGSDLKTFLEHKKKSRKHKCKENEIYCVKCRKPRFPNGMIASILVLNQRQALIQGICEVCGAKINRLTSTRKIAKVKQIFMIGTIRHKDLLESEEPNTNADFERA